MLIRTSFIVLFPIDPLRFDVKSQVVSAVHICYIMLHSANENGRQSSDCPLKRFWIKWMYHFAREANVRVPSIIGTFALDSHLLL